MSPFVPTLADGFVMKLERPEREDVGRDISQLHTLAMVKKNYKMAPVALVIVTLFTALTHYPHQHRPGGEEHLKKSFSHLSASASFIKTY